MEDIMVSICCLTYNHEKHIKQTLDGFIKQKTNFKYEVLIHDDASTDGTADIIKEYEKKYPDIIKPIYQTENQYAKRVSISYTYQYPRAKGKYVAFCEGDDYWTDENKLQKQVDFLEENQGYIACVHKYRVVDENDTEQDIKTFGYYENSGKYTFNDFFTNNLPSQLATLLLRNIFNDKEKGFPQELAYIRIAGDIRIYLWLLIYGDIYRMDEVMSSYRFVVKKGGKSYSSRMLKSCVNFNYWCEICKLEKLMKKLYGMDVYFEQRRLEFALGTVKDLRKCVNFKTLKNAYIVIVKQRGMVREIFNGFFQALKRRLRK